MRPSDGFWAPDGPKWRRLMESSSSAIGENGHRRENEADGRSSQSPGPCGLRKPSLSHRICASGEDAVQLPQPMQSPDPITSAGL